MRIAVLTLAAVALVGCSGAEDEPSVANNQGTPESDTGGELDGLPPLAEAPTQEDAYRCMEPFTYGKWPTECDAMGVTPPGQEGVPDIPQTSGSEPVYFWPDEEVEVSYEILENSPAPDTHRSESVTPGFDERSRILLTVTNKGAGPIEFGSEPGQINPRMTLLTGENGIEATSWAVTNGTAVWPTRLVPGSSATYEFDFTYPTTDIGEIDHWICECEYIVANQPHHTFTEVPL